MNAHSNPAVDTARRMLSSLALAVLLAACGCDQSPSPTAGKGISNLSSSPTSIPGKSAQMAKGAASGIQAQQDAAANAANQLTGQAAGEVVVGGLKFAIPEGWKSVSPSSSLVKATYIIPGAGNAQCNFSTAGGDVDSNIHRWRTQITGPDGKPVEGEVIQESAGGLRITLFKATGTYAAMGGGKQPNIAFRGAIIQAPAQGVFVRLTGPADRIGPAEAAWEQMVMNFGM